MGDGGLAGVGLVPALEALRRVRVAVGRLVRLPVLRVVLPVAVAGRRPG
ncbi:hypothetical protein [Nonomuraea pusilla]|uniref:Uncharacterized protein n=1 Tax=Nonomuraea pusilla TaxID=46177 RepID=A0A1H7XXK6_9ACTN|nr:hypothetical protein [Nonomuraea pusilla]SEM38550.1 hypothetical protein SAMN05660976_05022 [Nonomuraea pusilla]